MQIVVALSGGLDSAVMTHQLLSNGVQVTAVSFRYGSKHNEEELAAAETLANYFSSKFVKFSHEVIDVSNIFAFSKSNLLLGQGDIPKGHYQHDNMKLTVVPGRNLIFGSILACIAQSIGFDSIALGVHSGDHAIYPDCRPDFIHHLNQTVQSSSEGAIRVYTPLLGLSKTEIVGIGIKLGTPFQLTRTCYEHNGVACGECGSCNERLEAFSNNNFVDPLKYKTNEK